MYVSAVISYSLAYDAAEVTNHDNLVTGLSAQIQIRIMLIGMVRQLSMEPINLAKRWGITSEKAQNTIQATSQKGIRTMLHPSFLR